jgi:hypothetical protein
VRKIFMIQQQVISGEQTIGTLYDFAEYKKWKPFFKKPIKITIGNTINESYFMVKNVVYKGIQVLALKKEQDPNTIILVEGKIENGKLIYISMLSDEYLGDIGSMWGTYDTL